MVVELALPGFVVIFFGIGAWITALFVWLGLLETLNAQLLVFLGASVLSLVALRSWLQRTLQGRVTERELSESRLDDFVGHKAKVTVAISPDSDDGRVEFRGTEWAATAKVAIAAEATVRIVSKDNLTLRVVPIN
jgi:membrane protein implicated in regulation of membrane protease activity